MERVNLINIGTSFTPEAVAALPAKPFDALYVHVPFCVKKCHYCDFYSIADRAADHMHAYVDALLAEAAWWTTPLARSETVFDSVFFGGGTPTMLPKEEMARLLRGLRERLPIGTSAEWTVEANPATVDLEYCQQLRENGVNRLSVGAQSFIPSELKALGRVHDGEAVKQTIHNARAAGIPRFSIDLIYAVPGQTLESWTQSLDEAMALDLSHISCYCLTLEEETPMWRLTHSGRIPEVNEETQLAFMKHTRGYLPAKGLGAYEISNYARVGEECRHNLHYWRCNNYLGLGPAAASHQSGYRWRNRPDLGAYVQQVLNGAGVPVTDVETLTWQQRAEERVMMGLRTQEGVELADFRAKVGRTVEAAFGGVLDRLQCMSLLEVTGGRLRLTEQGIYVADQVIGELVCQVG